MDQRGVLAAFDEQLRMAERRSVSGGRLERIGNVVGCVGREWAGIEWSDLDESSADAAIAAQIDYFAGLGRSFEWKYYTHDQPADLADRLRRAGLEPDEAEALMIADLADVPMDLAPPEGIELVPVTDAAGVEKLVRVHEEVFGEDYSAFGTSLLERLAQHPEAVTPVLAIARDRPVSGARIDFHPGPEFPSLWGGGTLPGGRGKGIYRVTVGYRARPPGRR